MFTHWHLSPLYSFISGMFVVLCSVCLFQSESAASSEPQYSLDATSTRENHSFLEVGESQGNSERVFLQTPEISIHTMDGWKVLHLPAEGITLRMIGPEETIKQGMNTLRFKPTLNVQTLYRSEPIDKVREASFLEDLLEQYTEKQSLEKFQILSSERVDFKGERDALVVFSSYLSSGVEILQLHVLVAGPNQQYLVSYSDLQELYAKNKLRGELAWETIFSLNYDGVAKARYTSTVASFGLVLSLFILFNVLLAIKRMRQRKSMREMIRSKGFSYSVVKKSSKDLVKTKVYPAKPQEDCTKEIDLGFA